MNYKLFNLALVGAMLMLVSCDKDDDDDQPVDTNTTGTAQIEFEHTWGMMGDHFHLNDWFVQPTTGDSLNFSDLRYYVTDVSLTDVNGNVWEEPESYYLIDIEDHMGGIFAEINDVPAGDYTSMSFLLGVDSSRVAEGAQPGVLAPSDMFWSWNSGYIFLRMEGASPNAVDNGGAFVFHVGGWKEPNVASVRKTIDFEGQVMEVHRDVSPTVHLNVNMAHIWHDGTNLGEVPTIHMPGQAAKNMMTHFSHSINLDHIHN